jgi:hypothetical protein
VGRVHASPRVRPLARAGAGAPARTSTPKAGRAPARTGGPRSAGPSERRGRAAAQRAPVPAERRSSTGAWQSGPDLARTRAGRAASQPTARRAGRWRAGRDQPPPAGARLPLAPWQPGPASPAVGPPPPALDHGTSVPCGHLASRHP